MTHAESDPCPFAADNFPVGLFATCCSLRGKAAAYELEALGEVDLSNAMYNDMTESEALAFAGELRQAATRLEKRYADAPEKPHGAGWGRLMGKDANGELVWSEYTPFDEIPPTIRKAADWYEKVARLGFGVNAWF